MNSFLTNIGEQTKIKVIQLQYAADSSGDFVRRLHQEFLNSGIDSKILVLHSTFLNDKRIEKMNRKGRGLEAVNNLIESRLTKNSKKELGKFSYPVLGSNVTNRDVVKEADVIYLHWVLNGFISIKSLEELAKLGKPIVFIMHDMWTMTGGCHHSFTCEKYKTMCHSCQFFDEKKKKDLSYKLFHKKLKLFSSFDNFHFVSPSRWLYNCAKESALLKEKPLHHIPNVLDRNIFKPVDKKVAKKMLNIDEHKKVIAFGAASVKSPYKGWEYLKLAINELYQRVNSEDFMVVTFGKSDLDQVNKSIPFETKVLGYLRDELTMSLVYNATDVFIAPSLADNLPYTVFEALACGTPVVAFKTGGIPELIRHKENGYLAERKNATDIVNGISYCLDHKTKGYALPFFDNNRSMAKHLKLIKAFLPIEKTQ